MSKTLAMVLYFVYKVRTSSAADRSGPDSEGITLPARPKSAKADEGGSTSKSGLPKEISSATSRKDATEP